MLNLKNGEEIYAAYVAGNRFISADDAPTEEDCLDRFAGVHTDLSHFYQQFTSKHGFLGEEPACNVAEVEAWASGVFYTVPVGGGVAVFAMY